MAASKEAVSFDEIIQADRQRKKNEALADQIFGRGRKTNAENNSKRKQGPGPSLASRVGISKASQRSNSNTPRPQNHVESAWGHDLHDADSPRGKTSRPAKDNQAARTVQKDLLYEAATSQSAKNRIEAEISIRGKAGPYVVIGTNFAPGTTAADIESAMQPVGGEMQSCRITSAIPTVAAEMVFAERQNAEMVIETFNNKKADGRILHIYMKRGPPSLDPVPMSSVRSHESKSLIPQHQPITRDDPPLPLSESRSREPIDHRSRAPRAEPDYQDGSYGFEAKDNAQMDVDMDATPSSSSNPANAAAAAAAAAPAPPSAPQSLPPSAPTSSSSSHRRDDRGGYDRRDNRYDQPPPPRGYGRGGRYDDRDRGYGRPPRDDRRLYSDGLYQRPHGGYR